MNNKMIKFYIGLSIVAAVTIGLFIYTVSLGSSNKQDAQTSKKAQELATKLNSYISSKGSAPGSLSDLNVQDIPNTIKYTKNDDGTYKFCATYKSDTSYGSYGPDITGLIFGSAVIDTQTNTTNDTYSQYGSSSYQPSTLYLSSYHKKGENCQTVKPYTYSSYSNSSSSSLYGSSYGTTTLQNDTISVKVRDTERETDIKALASHLETYYAQEGKYPSLGNLSSVSWIKSNLNGLDEEDLKDPVGKSSFLYSIPHKNYYSYSAKSKTGGYCDNVNTDCASFTLTATLEGGGTYVKKSLN